jgi:hypothetical protein
MRRARSKSAPQPEERLRPDDTFSVSELQEWRRDNRLSILHALEEEIGIPTDILGWCERDCIDPFLDHDMAGCRKPGDPMSKRADEMIERVGGQLD